MCFIFLHICSVLQRWSELFLVTNGSYGSEILCNHDCFLTLICNSELKLLFFKVGLSILSQLFLSSQVKVILLLQPHKKLLLQFVLHGSKRSCGLLRRPHLCQSALLTFILFYMKKRLFPNSSALFYHVFKVALILLRLSHQAAF